MASDDREISYLVNADVATERLPLQARLRLQHPDGLPVYEPEDGPCPWMCLTQPQRGSSNAVWRTRR